MEGRGNKEGKKKKKGKEKEKGKGEKENIEKVNELINCCPIAVQI
jgi:hypothetical protein